jgi:type II secretory pathway component PulK
MCSFQLRRAAFSLITQESEKLILRTKKKEDEFRSQDIFKKWQQQKTYFPNEKCNNLPAALSFFFPVDPVIVSCSGLENTLG